MKKFTLILSLCLACFTICFSTQSDYAVNDDITLGIKKSDIEEIYEYVTANDYEGFLASIKRKLKDGSAFRITKGTKVRVIDNGFFYSKVRVLTGSHKNRVGFIDKGQLK